MIRINHRLNLNQTISSYPYLSWDATLRRVEILCNKKDWIFYEKHQSWCVKNQREGGPSCATKRGYRFLFGVWVQGLDSRISALGFGERKIKRVLISTSYTTTSSFCFIFWSERVWVIQKKELKSTIQCLSHELALSEKDDPIRTLSGHPVEAEHVVRLFDIKKNPLYCLSTIVIIDPCSNKGSNLSR